MPDDHNPLRYTHLNPKLSLHYFLRLTIDDSKLDKTSRVILHHAARYPFLSITQPRPVSTTTWDNARDDTALNPLLHIKTSIE